MIRKIVKSYCTWGVLAVLLTASVVMAIDAADGNPALSIWGKNNPGEQAQTADIQNADHSGSQPLTAGEKSAYVGNFRIYVVEPEARWKDLDSEPYHYGFLGYALNVDITLTDTPYSGSVVWDADDYSPVYALSESNIEVIGVVFGSEGHQAYSDPPSGYPFTAYYSDACASAKPGEPGSNSTAGGFTHTVFLEEGTAPWCPSCPGANFCMSYIKENMNLNFEYAALVTDGDYMGQASPADVNLRYSEVNLHWLPTVYFDGGMDVYSNGALFTQPYVDRINAAGARSVVPLNLDISMTYLGGNAIQVDYTVSYPGWTNSAPDEPEAPAGDDLKSCDALCNFTAEGFDSDYQQIYMRWDYGDGTISDWDGPFNNDQPCQVSYSWPDAGTYDVKVQVKDAMDVESPWSDPLAVTIFVCGDSNEDGTVNVLDVIDLINFKFKNGPAPNILESVDVNNDGTVNVLDVIYLINFKFKGGPDPVCP